jgi:predicted NAD-dependent protein-ADP-ribosyltransferase YbiA (DUF1768 family)
VIRVVNKNTHKPTPDDFYIGRGSVMGNPYHHKESKHPQAIYRVATAEEAIFRFEHYLNAQILKGDPFMCDFINTLIIRELTGKDSNLVCFCDPDPCHGSTIKKYVESKPYCINWFSNMRTLNEPIVYQGINYWTVENFYVAMKVPNNSVRHIERQKIAQMNPGLAKKYGRTIKVRGDWDMVKMDFMRIAIEQKFKKGTTWYEKLLSFDKPVIEWNNWKDRYWGKCIFTGEGENHLGKLIDRMKTEEIYGDY